MTRKEFLKAGLAGLFSVAFISLSKGCSSPSSPDEASGGENSDSQRFASSSASGHSHSVTLQRSEIQNPPASGITKSTTSSSGHAHSFTMTRQQLQNVNSGQTVNITDSQVSGHTHQYSISKWF